MHNILKQKQQIAQRFNRAAKSYDEAAIVQRRAGNRLLNSINQFNLKPYKIVDLGCGTGYFSKAIATTFSHASVIGFDLAYTCLSHSSAYYSPNNLTYICADFDYLPFARNSFDMIFSNMALQWSFNLIDSLTKMKQILSPNGYLLFSIPGPLMLTELISSLKLLNPLASYHTFQNCEQLTNLLFQTGFTTIETFQETFKQSYPSLNALLQELKNTGVTYIKNNKLSILKNKSNYFRLIDIYKDRFQSFNATYDFIYIIAYKNHD